MRILLAGLLTLWAAAGAAQTAPVSATTTGAPVGKGVVTVSGTVPNQTTKATIVERLRKVYGADRVVDHIAVGEVVAPARWNRDVLRMIGPDLKQVSHGQITIEGNTIDVRGEVPNEVTRQRVLSHLASAFDANYGIQPHLQIRPSGQKVLDRTLADRTVQFESGSAVLTADGRVVLDQMAVAISKLHDPLIAVIGNTDSVGNRASNIELSLARANAVKAYLVSKGIPAANLSVSGQGPDDPIASNDTDAGRARNRRTDFRVLK